MAGNDYRQELTDRLITALENGTAPWQKPWDGSGGGFFPLNPTTDKAYRGGNAIWLMMQGYDDPRWCTFNQANEQGWKIRKGEKATWIEYWKWSDTIKETDEEGQERSVEVRLENPKVFYAKVFNLSQMENIPELTRTAPAWDVNSMAEAVLAKTGADILHDQVDRAFYSVWQDKVHLPPKASFPDEAKYYATAFHEIGHWTGHESRLNRVFGTSFGSEEYAKEELRAELASLFLADRFGLPFEIDQHAAYVGSWIKALKEDKHEIFKASRDAEKIAEYVMGLALEVSVEKAHEELEETKVADKRIYLHVPFSERAEAKAAGARWDQEATAWYVPKGGDVGKFSRWERPRDSREAIKEFGELIRDAGLILEGEPTMDGKWHYLPVEGGRKAEKQGSYKGSLDGTPNGYIKNYFDNSRSRGWKFDGATIDPSRAIELEQKALAAAQKREAEDAAEMERVSRNSTAKFNKLPDADLTEAHWYLMTKGVMAFGLKKDDDKIVIPMRDLDGKIWSFQTITPDGEKKYAYHGRKKGCFHVIGDIKPGEPILFLEGYATAASAHLATNRPSVVTFDSGNIMEVALAFKEKYPDSLPVICGDDDRFLRCPVGWTKEGEMIRGAELPNSGKNAALETAEKVGGVAVFPKFHPNDYKGTDFNDVYLYKQAGIDQIRNTIESAIRNLDHNQNKMMSR